MVAVALGADSDEMDERMGEQPSEARQPKAASTQHGYWMGDRLAVHKLRLKPMTSGELGPREESHLVQIRVPLAFRPSIMIYYAPLDHSGVAQW